MVLTERLRFLRESAELSARGADRVVGLHPNHWAALEIGRWAPKTETALAIATAFGASFEWLVFGTGKAPSPRKIRASVASAKPRKSKAA